MLITRDLREGELRAGDETRTRDVFLGKEVLYQLSYTRVFFIGGGNDASEASGIKQILSKAWRLRSFRLNWQKSLEERFRQAVPKEHNVPPRYGLGPRVWRKDSRH